MNFFYTFLLLFSLVIVSCSTKTETTSQVIESDSQDEANIFDLELIHEIEGEYTGVKADYTEDGRLVVFNPPDLYVIDSLGKIVNNFKVNDVSFYNLHRFAVDYKGRALFTLNQSDTVLICDLKSGDITFDESSTLMGFFMMKDSICRKHIYEFMKYDLRHHGDYLDWHPKYDYSFNLYLDTAGRAYTWGDNYILKKWPKNDSKLNESVFRSHILTYDILLSIFKSNNSYKAVYLRPYSLVIEDLSTNVQKRLDINMEQGHARKRMLNKNGQLVYLYINKRGKMTLSRINFNIDAFEKALIKK